jgi:phosphoribosylformylglycinamidine synthase
MDLELEAQVQAACREGIRQGWVNSAHDCSDGGLAIALAECCISGKMGASVQLEIGDSRLDEALFGEGGARILVSVAPDRQAEWEAFLGDRLSRYWREIGTVGGGALKLATAGGEVLIHLPVEQMQTTFDSAIPRRLSA